MSNEIKDKIFLYGFSSRNSTGRGLALCKQIVEEKLSGILDFENIKDELHGEGVKFTIVIEYNEHNHIVNLEEVNDEQSSTVN